MGVFLHSAFGEIVALLVMAAMTGFLGVILRQPLIVLSAIGIGKGVGDLLAGVSLASTPYRETIVARLAPLRDFLLLFFFIALGSALALSLLGAHVTGAVIFSLFVLIDIPPIETEEQPVS